MALYADQYKTTMVGGMTTIGGPTAIHDREDDEFNEKYCQLEELIGEDMMNVLSKTENLDGTSDFNGADSAGIAIDSSDDPHNLHYGIVLLRKAGKVPVSAESVKECSLDN
ncbi:unnamed protein product [Angiostrongylus costaricensis]|uniref:Ketoacyl_synth_N domain-containing protein n=1 Tax=Angiostrongylus costaricensis TaxID=334426 RepID=A0A0R3PYU6_ANGCS|nr:unnamed protein product [Angiostrongylus costaricensis]